VQKGKEYKIKNVRVVNMDKPLVTIVLAVYKPVICWFELLLKSLNNQDYNNKELIIYNDNPAEPLNKEFILKYINFPFKIIEGKKNVGSNKAFEKLTNIAQGDYIAYCDQDDIWEDNKISLEIEKITMENAEMVCSDLSVIDAQGKQIHKSFKEVSKRHIYYSGSDVYKILFIRNFVVGCTLVIRSDTAKQAIPFSQWFYHDHWLALFSSMKGKVCVVDKPLIRYRIHGGNQTGVFIGIETKNDYFEKRIDIFYKRTIGLKNRIKENNEIVNYYNDVLCWAEARFEYYKKFSIKNAVKIIKYRKFGTSVSIFELMLPFIPKIVFNYILIKIKEGKM